MKRALGWVVGAFGMLAACAVGCSSTPRNLTGSNAGASGSGAGASGNAGTPGSAGALGKAGTAGRGDVDAGAGGEPSGDAGAGGAGAPGDGPRVLSVTPADGATAVDPGTTISLKFSEPLDATTVTSGSVELKDEQGTAIDGDVSYSGTTAVFTPSAPLGLLGVYTISVSRAASNADGAALAEPFSASFTVRDGSWTSEKPLSKTTLGLPTSGELHVVGDGRTHALAVWAQNASTDFVDDLIGSVYTLGAGWSSPANIGTTVRNNDCFHECVTQIAVAMNKDGDAIVAWLQDETSAAAGSGDKMNVAARVYKSGTWQPTTRNLDDHTGVTYRQDLGVAMSPTGESFVTWSNYGTAFERYTRRAEASGVWATSLDQIFYSKADPLSFSIYSMSMVFADNGDGFALGQANENNSSDIVVSRFLEATKKWSLGSSIDSGNLTGPALAVDASGKAMAVWSKRDVDDKVTTVKASAYNKAWGTAVTIGQTSDYTSTMSLISTPAGFLAGWTQGAGVANLMVSELKSAAWTEPTILSSGDYPVTGLPFMTTDALGNATVLWTQDNGQIDLEWSRRGAGSNTWSDPLLLESTADSIAQLQGGVTALADGSLVAGWRLVPSLTRPPYFQLFR